MPASVPRAAVFFRITPIDPGALSSSALSLAVSTRNVCPPGRIEGNSDELSEIMDAMAADVVQIKGCLMSPQLTKWRCRRSVMVRRAGIDRQNRIL